MKFELPISTLRAARLCTATKDVRYYLMGVHVDLARGKVEATTGHLALILAGDRKSTRLNSSHVSESRMPSSA